MKKLILTIIFPILVQGQYYKATSNLFSTNKEVNNLDIGINYEFKNTQFQGIYNINKKYSVFATYNFNQSTTEYTTFIWGDKRAVDVDNSGYSFGLLMHKNGRVGAFKNLEFLLGFENQTVFTADYFVNYHPESKEYLSEKYYKIFVQFNMIKIRKEIDFGYSCKLSYFQFTEYDFYNSYKGNFNGKGTLFLDPTLNFNYKPGGNKNLKLTSQIGFSAALNTLKDEQTWGDENNQIFSSYSEETYLLSFILKFGLQYNFNLKNEKL
jgi:hypothetical protein